VLLSLSKPWTKPTSTVVCTRDDMEVYVHNVESDRPSLGSEPGRVSPTEELPYCNAVKSIEYVIPSQRVTLLLPDT
jgi:hypothetical protein